jgi:predicted HTH domain antitoxin
VVRRDTMTTVQVRFPDDVFAALRKSPSEVEREVRLAAAIDWYRRGLISQGRAAELAGLARADFLDELAARKIDVFHVDVADLQRELERG